MNAKELKGILSRAKRAINPSAPLPILQRVMFHDGCIHSASLPDRKKILVDQRYSYKDHIFNGLEGTVEFKDLNDIVTKLKSSEVKLSAKKDGANTSLVISSGKKVFTINMSDDVDDWLEPINGFEYFYDLDQEKIDLISKAWSYTSLDALRPVMTGVFFDKEGYIVGCDAHKMCFYKTNSFPDNAILGTKLVDRPCEVYVCHKSKYKRYFKFISGNETVISEEIEGKYPQWRHVLPNSTPIHFEVDANRLLESVDMCSTVYNKTSKFIWFDLDTDKSYIRTKDVDLNKSFEDEMPASNEKFTVGMNGEYVRTIIKTEGFDTVKFKFRSHDRAFMIGDEVILTPMLKNV